MCGVLDADAAMTDRLTLGYRDAVAVDRLPVLAAPATPVPATSSTAPPSTPAHGDRAGLALGRRGAEGFVAGRRARVLPAHCTGPAHPDAAAPAASTRAARR